MYPVIKKNKNEFKLNKHIFKETYGLIFSITVGLLIKQIVSDIKCKLTSQDDSFRFYEIKVIN